MTTISRRNLYKSAPVWFRKTKKALTILQDTAVVMLLALGQAEHSLLMLMIRVGLSGGLTALEAVLADEK